MVISSANKQKSLLVEAQAILRQQQVLKRCFDLMSGVRAQISKG